MFGLTVDKLVIIAIIAVFLVGPERLPHYAGRLADLIRGLRDFTDSAKNRLRHEMGPEIDDIDWKKLDPRQFDPRRIVREALADDDTTASPLTPEGGGVIASMDAESEPAVAVARPAVLRAGSDGRYRRL